MTETTTKDRTDTTAEDLLDAAARASAEAGSKSLAMIEPTQDRFTPDQVAILRQIGLEDATDGDLNLFFHVCRTTGLDPFRKQIYMIGRNTKVVEWVEDDRAQNGRRRIEKWVTKYTIQTGINGYRRNGREAAKRLGDSLTFDGPYWCGEDGEWREVWPAKKPPVAAKFTVFRNGEPFSAVVHYDEFVQTNSNGQPNSMWDRMPRNQTAKCAEAMAFRRAYPDDFSGLLFEDAAIPTVIDQDGNVERAGEPEKRRPAGGSGINAVRAERERRQQQRRNDDVIEGEVIHESTNETPQETLAGAGDTNEADTQVENATASTDQGPAAKLRESARKTLNDKIVAVFGKLGMDGDTDEDRADRLVIVRAIVERDVESTKDLSDDELQKLRNGLVDRDKAGTLESAVTEWLNIAALREANAAEQAES